MAINLIFIIFIIYSKQNLSLFLLEMAFVYFVFIILINSKQTKLLFFMEIDFIFIICFYEILIYSKVTKVTKLN